MDSHLQAVWLWDFAPQIAWRPHPVFMESQQREVVGAWEACPVCGFIQQGPE